MDSSVSTVLEPTFVYIQHNVESCIQSVSLYQQVVKAKNHQYFTKQRRRKQSNAFQQSIPVQANCIRLNDKMTNRY